MHESPVLVRVNLFSANFSSQSPYDFFVDTVTLYPENLADAEKTEVGFYRRAAVDPACLNNDLGLLGVISTSGSATVQLGR